MVRFIDDEIHTERLYMRKLREGDLNAYYEFMKKDEVGQWLSSGRGKTYTETKQVLERISKHWKEKNYGVWGVVDQKTGELIGHCGLSSLAGTAEVEVLYAFHPKAWGKGYGTEATKAAIQYGFTKVNLNRIIAIAYPNNLKSRRVMEKCGLHFVGVKQYFGLESVCYEIFNSSIE